MSSSSVQSTVEKSCYYCQKSMAPNREVTCIGCSAISYCSERCGGAHWEQHKSVCWSMRVVRVPPYFGMNLSAKLQRFIAFIGIK